VLNFLICDLQKGDGRATVLSARAGIGPENVAKLVGRRRCSGDDTYPVRPSQAPSGHFLRPSRLALMAQTPAERARAYRARKRAEVKPSGRSLTLIQGGKLDDEAVAPSAIRELLESVNVLQRHQIALHEAVTNLVTIVTGSVTEIVTVRDAVRDGFRDAVTRHDASHNRAHALLISISDLVSYMYEKKEGTSSELSGYEDLVRPRDAVTPSVTLVTPSRDGDAVTVRDAVTEDDGESSLAMRRKSKSEMQALLQAPAMSDQKHREEVARSSRWAELHMNLGLVVSHKG
jgi:hypothetical protein